MTSVIVTLVLFSGVGVATHPKVHPGHIKTLKPHFPQLPKPKKGPRLADPVPHDSTLA